MSTSRREPDHHRNMINMRTKPTPDSRQTMALPMIVPGPTYPERYA